MWFFVRRRWANRITAKQGLPAAGKETSLLVELMVWSAKQSEATAAQLGRPIPKAEAVLLAGCSMVRNATAAQRVSQDLGVDAYDALTLLVGLRSAALQVATEHGFDRLVQVEAQKG
jgi:hypothetical protein